MIKSKITVPTVMRSVAVVPMQDEIAFKAEPSLALEANHLALLIVIVTIIAILSTHVVPVSNARHLKTLRFHPPWSEK